MTQHSMIKLKNQAGTGARPEKATEKNLRRPLPKRTLHGRNLRGESRMTNNLQ